MTALNVVTLVTLVAAVLGAMSPHVERMRMRLRSR